MIICTNVISIHALLAESDNLRVVDGSKSSIISIHALLAESDSTLRQLQSALCYFYPRSPCGERQYITTITICIALFLSTLSLRRATPRTAGSIMCTRFLSTLSLRRATHNRLPSIPSACISIHALLAESDISKNAAMGNPTFISIHALLAESDLHCLGGGLLALHFYPRSPCGERREKKSSGAAVFTISIHALLAESDRLLIFVDMRCCVFLSTLSLRRATLSWSGETTAGTYFYPRSPCGERPRSAGPWQAECMDFYPRSPCGERPNQPTTVICQSYFYPRSPCGERPTAMLFTFLSFQFLSTLSLRRATWS